MKINLLLQNPLDIRSGHLNVDPYANGQDGRVKGRLLDLSPLVDANEASELIAHDILDFFGAVQVDQALNHWLSRLAHGGKIVVSAIDVGEVGRAFLSGTIDLDTANTLLYGEQDKPGRWRKSALTLSRLAAVLEGKDLKVLSKRVANYRGVVTAIRP